MYEISLIAALMLFLTAGVSGQDSLRISSRDTVRLSREDSLRLVHTGDCLRAKWDSLEKATNHRKAAMRLQEFCRALEKWYDDSLSFFHNLPQLEKIGQVYARDSLLKITSWNIPREDGSMKYYTYFQRIRPDSSGYHWIRIQDNARLDVQEDQKQYTAQHWYGALYYEAVPFTFKDTARYLLLGIDLKSRTISRKVLDVVTFVPGKGSKDRVVFGCPCLMQPDGSLHSREVFHYSARVSMVMRYEPLRKRVVMDHLSPPRKALEGDFRFYGPDFSYDAYDWLHGYWRLLRDVDVRNTQKPPL